MKCLSAKVRKNDMQVRQNNSFSENMQLVYPVIPDIRPDNMLNFMIVRENLDAVMDDLFINSCILRGEIAEPDIFPMFNLNHGLLI